MTEKTKASTEFKLKEKQNLIKSIFLIKHSDTKNTIDQNLLGNKRKLFKKTKLKKENKNKKENKINKNNLLLITKSIEYFINSTNIKNNEICIICLEKIDSKERHFLHCGHFFHCCCINKWISMDKNKCPMCKQDIECNKSFEDDSINGEDDNDNDNDNDNINQNVIEINRNNDDPLSILLFYFWIIIIIFMFKGFCLKASSVW